MNSYVYHKIIHAYLSLASSRGYLAQCIVGETENEYMREISQHNVEMGIYDGYWYNKDKLS